MPTSDATAHVLPDLLAPGLVTVFCGSAVGAASARIGAPYAGPGNKFWPMLAETGLTPRRFAPGEFRALIDLGLKPEDAKDRVFYYGKGCDFCNKTGYKGRSALYEIMRADSNIRDLIIQSKSTEVLRAEAVAAGMRTLRDAGILKIFDGLTTIEEVVRETLAFE